KKIFKEQVAFNLISRVGKLEEDGFTDIERTVVKEIKRILSNESVPLSLSLIQAPIFHTYSILSFIEFIDSPTISDLENIFKKSSLFEITSPNETPPSPVSTAGKDKICIGQIKRDRVFSNSFWFWLVADNLTRGSVLNAVEVAEKLISIKFPAINK
ncbi:Asd/ArgC dimerization domain-containing protein, partial [Candidatus Aminicenantes bacterium AC-334-E05]|nr:Asd/ArgC dimerization domain-containing protein [Candidatus Aminicenantes bacterium AC-334-E05]